jgi:hypothetical protein
MNEASRKYPAMKRDPSDLILKLIVTKIVNRIKRVINTIERLETNPKLFFDLYERNRETEGTTKANEAIPVTSFKPKKVLPVSLGTR